MFLEVDGYFPRNLSENNEKILLPSKLLSCETEPFISLITLSPHPYLFGTMCFQLCLSCSVCIGKNIFHLSDHDCRNIYSKFLFLFNKTDKMTASLQLLIFFLTAFTS